MKTIFRNVRLVLIVSAAMTIFASCGSQMERDAEKMAKRAIEFEQVQKRFGDRSNLFGQPMSREELEKYNKEYIEYANQMFEKYGETPEMHTEFAQMVNKKMEELR